MVGIDYHLEDASLQQFVNSKTNSPVEFSYQSYEFNGEQVGIIHIPPQERPIFLTQEFGKLEDQTVYLRRGSSTDAANPAEVAKMGKARVSRNVFPEIGFEFAHPFERSELGKEIHLEVVNLSLPNKDNIPDHGSKSGIRMFYPNRDYYRDMADYLKYIHGFQPLRFTVSNIGEVTVKDVRIEARISNRDVKLLDKNSFPSKPKPRSRPFDVSTQGVIQEHDVTVQDTNDGHRIIAHFGKCQPKQTKYSSSYFFIGAEAPSDVSLYCSLFADEISEPIEETLEVEIDVNDDELTKDDLFQKIKEDLQ